jgi:hypothetical protein
MQRVIGGEIFWVDTEAKRALHYAPSDATNPKCPKCKGAMDDVAGMGWVCKRKECGGRFFKFRHVPFLPPFGPLDYLGAIEHCISKGAKIIIIDSMTHEHNGMGGVMTQTDEIVDRIIAKKRSYLRDGEHFDEDTERSKAFVGAQRGPKGDRKRLNARIVQLGINAIFCYRAAEKIKMRGGKVESVGWQPETTSPLVYEMAQQFLLEPGSDGVPQFRGDTKEESQLIKSPDQFRDWFKQGQRLDEDMGEKMARWAAGDVPTTDAGPRISPLEFAYHTRFEAAQSDEEITIIGQELNLPDNKKRFAESERLRLIEAAKTARSRVNGK